MSTPKWTASQKLAIETTGRNVLVTASAGTGKTAVLSQRCIERICDKIHPADADRILVLTFTEAAADEMKGRITDKLSAAAASEPSGRLRRQLVLLEAASIGTIHGFCKRILSEHFYLSGLDPRFGILDPDQRDILRTEAMSEALEEAWNNETMASQLRTLFDGRNLRSRSGSFIHILLSVADFLDSVPDRRAFYQSATGLSAESPLAHQTLRHLAAGYLEEQLNGCARQVEYARQLEKDVADGRYLNEYIHVIRERLNSCITSLSGGHFDLACERLRTWIFDKLPSLSKKLEIDKEQAELVKAAVNDIRNAIKKIQKLVILYPAYLSTIANATQVQTAAMINLLQLFDAAYQRRKQSLAVLDFSDLEHHALSLLQTHPEVGQKLRDRFEHVFIDEYQDINAVQHQILQQVCRKDNLFIVGDVKQSIYGFRQSRPELFLKQLETASDNVSETDTPLRIDMNVNFRSRRDVLDFINHLFKRIMTHPVGGMDYDLRAELKAGMEYPAEIEAHQAVELYLLDEDNPDDHQKDNDESDSDTAEDADVQSDMISTVQRQAAMISRRIRQMVGQGTGKAEFQVLDKTTGSLRDVRYRDIVILLRALSHRAAEYVEMLRLAGIPVSSQNSCGYFAATEVADFLALLKTLDNPMQDIELAATLRSALFRFTDSQLAAMRFFTNQNKKEAACFYDVVLAYADCGPDAALRHRVKESLTTLDSWRNAARRKPLSELIWLILEETSFLAFVSALPNGPQRRANLLKLHDRAIQFESFVGSSGGRNVSAFVTFLEKLLDQDNDWAPAQPEDLSEDAVRIMSIHKSKGLEFPAVFLAELNWPFSTRDSRGPCMLNSEMIGLELLDTQKGLRLPTPSLQLIRHEKQRANLAEEMRILYVAMTRARQKLILTASQKLSGCRKKLNRWSRVKSLSDWDLIDAGNHLDWLMAGLADTEPLKQFLAAESFHSAEETLFALTCIDKQQLNALTGEIRDRRHIRGMSYCPVDGCCDNPEDTITFEKIKAILNWRYPDEPLTHPSGKYSVTALTHRDDEFSQPLPDTSFTVPSEQNLEAGSLKPDASAMGTATHLVIQHVPLTSSLSRTSVYDTIQDLRQQRLLSDRVADLIDIDSILSFFDTNIGQITLNHPARVKREWPFTLKLPIPGLTPPRSDAFVVVQGIVDMIISTDQGLIIVDFKTDHINSSMVSQRTLRYQPQLSLYAQAAKTILNRPVISANLFFLWPQTLQQVTILTEAYYF